MATTLVAATDAILNHLKTAWDAGANALAAGVDEPVLVYESLESDLKMHPRDTGKSWARITIRHAPESQKVSLTDSSKRARYRRTGTVWVQVFSPRKGASYYTEAQQLASLVRNAYEGKRTAADGVVFTEAALMDQNPEAAWWRYDVKVQFYWDEIHS